MCGSEVESVFHHLFHTNIGFEIIEVCCFKLFKTIAKELITLSISVFLYYEFGYVLWQILFCYLLWQFSLLVVLPFVHKLGIKHSMVTQCLWGIVLFLSLPYILKEDFFGGGLWECDDLCLSYWK